MADNQGIPFSTPDEGTSYPDIAKEIVYQLVKHDLSDLGRHGTFGKDEVYIVWFVKALQNWKALVSTSLPDGRYYEVTFNGNKKVAYVDTYVKTANHEVVIGDVLL